MYDYLVVGLGLFGSVFAYEAKRAGKRVLAIDKRAHIGGNCYTRCIEGINVHMHGAHIFHTNNKAVWNYVNRFCEFNRFTNSPIAIANGRVFNLPFNMNTFNQFWGAVTPKQAQQIIADDIKAANITQAENLEQQAIMLVGREIYQTLIKGYTTKQWGKSPDKLDKSIIKRLPLRFTFDNNYFSDRYQGVPIGGYTAIFERLLEGVAVELNTDFVCERSALERVAKRIIYTAPIDEYFDYSLGELEYRSLRFETEILKTDNYQGCAVVNYADAEIPYTRIIEHKHFETTLSKNTVITREYPCEYKKGGEAYYPVPDGKNAALYQKYADIEQKNTQIVFGGRLGTYQYLDMDKTIACALDLCARELN